MRPVWLVYRFLVIVQVRPANQPTLTIVVPYEKKYWTAWLRNMFQSAYWRKYVSTFPTWEHQNQNGGVSNSAVRKG